jgi:acyl-coenzyme A synthetase/AMP-(fatty) acid ligase
MLTAQLAPRISLKRPISMGTMPARAAETFGRVPIYLDRPFDVDPQRREKLDYVQFAEIVEQLSGALWEAGVRPWDRIAVVKEPNFDNIALAWAAARIGAIPALLTSRLDGEILRILLGRLNAPFLYTDQATVESSGIPSDTWRQLTGRLIGPVEHGIGLEQLWGGEIPDPAPRRDDEPMIITHTSSTTGISKLSEASVAGSCYTARVEAMTPFGHSPRELAATCISFVHIRATLTTMAALSRGTRLLAIADPAPAAVARLFTKYRPTCAETHPNVFVDWEELCSHPEKPLATIRVYFNSFDAPHPRTVTRLLAASERTLPIWFNAYGMTETQLITFRIYTRRLAARLSRRGRSRSVGWAPPGAQVRIVNPQTQHRVRRGRGGMIQVHTPARSLGFIGTPDKYWARRHGKWFDSGDWGRKGAWGDLEVLDRVADRIEGIESCLRIEDLLLDRLPDAKEVVVVGGESGRAVPVVTMRSGHRLTSEAWARASAGIGRLEAPVEVSEQELRRTATAKARRYLISELVARDQEDREVVFEDVLLRGGA